MATKGIIFSAPMVRALLDGRKTQTRRLCAWANNPHSPALTYIVACDEPGWFGDEEGEVQFKAGYAPGERLYVREAWSHTGQGVWSIQAARMIGRSGVIYHADGEVPGAKYWPSIHLPREFSRLWLAVADVRVQRVQDISEADARAEGCAGRRGPNPDFPDEWDPSPQEEFRDLWNSLHTKPGETWDDNPWIVAVTFDVHRGNIDAEVPA